MAMADSEEPTTYSSSSLFTSAILLPPLFSLLVLLWNNVLTSLVDIRLPLPVSLLFFLHEGRKRPSRLNPSGRRRSVAPRRARLLRVLTKLFIHSSFGAWYLGMRGTPGPYGRGTNWGVVHMNMLCYVWSMFSQTSKSMLFCAQLRYPSYFFPESEWFGIDFPQTMQAVKFSSKDVRVTPSCYILESFPAVPWLKSRIDGFSFTIYDRKWLGYVDISDISYPCASHNVCQENNVETNTP